MKCTRTNLQQELDRAEVPPTLLLGRLSRVTAQSAWFTPEQGEAFELRLNRHSAGSFTAALPEEDKLLVLLAEKDDKGFLVQLNVCNNSVFKADEKALNILRLYTPN